MSSFIGWNISSKFSKVTRKVTRKLLTRLYNYIRFLTAVLQAEFHKILSFFFFQAKVPHRFFFFASFFLTFFSWQTSAIITAVATCSWIILLKLLKAEYSVKTTFMNSVMNNLYESVNAMKIWKPIVSHKLYHTNRLM